MTIFVLFLVQCGCIHWTVIQERSPGIKMGRFMTTITLLLCPEYKLVFQWNAHMYRTHQLCRTLWLRSCTRYFSSYIVPVSRDTWGRRDDRQPEFVSWGREVISPLPSEKLKGKSTSLCCGGNMSHTQWTAMLSAFVVCHCSKWLRMCLFVCPSNIWCCKYDYFIFLLYISTHMFIFNCCSK